MQTAGVPPNEAERLEALRGYHVLDTKPESGFEDLARLAAHVCGTPVALVSMVDDQRQWSKAKLGLEILEIPRDHAFCSYAILRADPLIVPDASNDQRFRDSPLVTAEPGIRFYAGAPLITPNSLAVGTLCVLDYTPRTLDESQTAFLVALARQVVAQLESRRLHVLLDAQKLELNAALERQRINEHELQLRGQQLDTAIRQADEALQSRTRFLANVSHEVRTPLNGVVGMTDLLLGTSLTQEQSEYCKTLRFSTEGLLSVVNDILDFSNIGADKLVLNMKEFDLAETVDDALSLVGEPARSKDLRVHAFVDWNLPVKVEGDRLRLRQVLVHLVENAVKFTTNGEVSVRATRDRELDGRTRVRFEVRDTGVGITPQQRPRIFQAFSQADDSSSRRFGGTGLGLAIAQRLVQKMDGEIGFESEPNRGSLFWFYVWLRTKSGSVLDSTRHSHFRGKRVLVVNPSAAPSSVPAYLSGLGFEIVGCRSPGEPELSLATFDLVVVKHERARTGHGKLMQFLEHNTAHNLPILDVGFGKHAHRSPSSKTAGAVLEEPVRRSSLLSFLLSLFGPADARSKPPAALPKTQLLRVLVVEDNAVNQKVVCNMLRKLGHTFDLAQDGLVAVEAASRNPYDVILMDCQMPRMDGYEATKIIRRQPGPCRFTYIVAITASAMAEDREKCLDIGMNDYLAKPVTMDVLSAALNRCLSEVDTIATPGERG